MSNSTVTSHLAEAPTSTVENGLKSNRITAVPAIVTLRVIRRNGTVTPYDDSKISVAITKAFLAVEGSQISGSSRIHDLVAQMTVRITAALHQRFLDTAIHIEAIQDQVELELMRAGEYKVARAYVLYREEHRQLRTREKTNLQTETPVLHVIFPNNHKMPLDLNWLKKMIEAACNDLPEVSAEVIFNDTLKTLYDGVSLSEVEKAVMMSARVWIEKEPDYSFVAARLLLNQLCNEAFLFLGLPQTHKNLGSMQTNYVAYFRTYLERGIQLELIDPQLAHFDLEKITAALQAKRDMQFSYLGLQTLYDRYFLHSNGTRFELPQAFFMRVAMGLAIHEKAENRTQYAICFYDLISSFEFMCSTPTLFNAGTLRPQLSSCYLTTIADDLGEIYDALKDNALLSKYAGGLGNDWTPVRALGATIKGTNGKSQGVISFMNVANASCTAVDQGGKRKGAVCAYLEMWHMDIEAFLELRKNTGDDRRRTHDMNTASWIPDLFMKRVFEDGNWTLFSPDETPDLHDLYGLDFEKAYIAYEEKGAQGKIRSKSLPANTLWRKLLSMLFETGHPWITFKDSCNLRSPQQHVGVIHSSNLCTEITLNTAKDEIAVCNLGSINLVKHLNPDQKGLNTKKLKATIQLAMRMLDNVIDINFYSVPQARRSNLRHRPVGLGLMGFHDILCLQGINYGSEEAVTFADQSMELISYYTIQASSDLAKERGCYDTYPGSLWSKGILPIDSIEYLQVVRGTYLEQDRTQTLDWDALRHQVMTVGMRNSNTMAIAPTATISNICGVSQSIEPTYQNLYVKSNLSGEFTIINPYLVRDLKKLNLWDEVMVNDLKYYNGSIQQISRIPGVLKNRYATAFEIEVRWLIEAASRRQKWLDQAQSLNLYLAEPSGKKLDILYRMAWLRGLKTTYYLRTLAATHVEKSTLATSDLNAIAVKACQIEDSECEACQ